MRLSASFLGFLVIASTGIDAFTTPNVSRPLSTRISQGSSYCGVPTFLASATSSSVSEERTPEEEAFFARTEQLCEERNLKLAKVKNARDLASVKECPIKPHRLYRMGRVSDATEADLHLLNDEIGIRTLVDLRSPTELKEDVTLERDEVYGEFRSLIWDERDNGSVKELREGEPRIKKKRSKNIMGHVRELVDGAKKGVDAATHGDEDTKGVQEFYVAAADLANASECEGECDDEDTLVIKDETANALLQDYGLEENDNNCPPGDEDCRRKNKRFVQKYAPNTIADDKSRGTRKERHFVSIMNELKYVRGTLSKVRKRDIAKTIIKSPGAVVSKRVRSSIKSPFLDKINGGGLPMLNDLLSRYGAPGIKYVLDLCKDKNRHPVAFYCTAGKDRTGMIAAIILAALGVPDEDIVEDYSLSANVYAEMGDNQAMVGALSQRSLDPKTFLGAPPQVMRDTIKNMRETYGSVEGYLDFIGFDENDRKELREALLSD